MPARGHSSPTWRRSTLCKALSLLMSQPVRSVSAPRLTDPRRKARLSIPAIKLAMLDMGGLIDACLSAC